MAVGVEYIDTKYDVHARNNNVLPNTPANRQMASWVERGGVLLTSLEPVSGLRTDIYGKLKPYASDEYRATSRIDRAAFRGIVQDRAVGEWVGHASSRPIRIDLPEEPPIGIEFFYSEQLLYHVRERERQGEETVIFLAERVNEEGIGFKPIKGGFEAYSPVLTPIAGEVSVSTDDLGLGFLIDWRDPIDDPQIRAIYKSQGIRLADIAAYEEGRLCFPPRQLQSLAQMIYNEAYAREFWGAADLQYQSND